jgi:formylmethanofuran dehydrogenase subunit E
MSTEETTPETEKVQIGWECRKCGDVFTKPRFRWDYDYEQMAPTCPCCNEYL